MGRPEAKRDAQNQPKEDDNQPYPSQYAKQKTKEKLSRARLQRDGEGGTSIICGATVAVNCFQAQKSNRYVLRIANSRVPTAACTASPIRAVAGNDDQEHNSGFHALDLNAGAECRCGSPGIAENSLDRHHAADEPVDVEHDDGDGCGQSDTQRTAP
ncbi:MAG: hypothetical protein M9896_18835 [Candidatus Promineofilum sp.]|uniref:hypothetical protein n=1 Tax=Promineifilum sp. TaxID=2664178 RepID=UPI002411BD75|nr:hypothetical protein [Promineifilum sp.]